MAYQTGTANNMNDLMTQLSTFAQGLGWTQDVYVAEAGTTDGRLSLHKDNCYVHWGWNSSKTPSIGMYQSLGFTPGADQDKHPDNSGNGPTWPPSTGATWNSGFDQYRMISEIGAGPYTSYFFFGDNATVDYIHVALEFAPFTYRHLGFGNLEKAWNWTGGEYAYGHTQALSDPNTQPSLLTSNGHPTSFAKRHPTMHVEGLPGQPANSKWGTFAAHSSLGSGWSDSNNNVQVRLVGSAPGSTIGSVFNNLPSNAGDGFLPLVPVAVFYIDVTPAPDLAYFLGWQPDVRTLNGRNFNPKDEITVAGDTWQVFPHVRKQNTGDRNESRNYFIAYKKIV